MRNFRQWLVAGVILVAVSAAEAHHSYTMFDMNKEIELKGVVKEFQWTNPHIWIQVLVTDPSGKETEWAIEGASPSMLTRAGWGRKSLKVGDNVVIVAHPARGGSAKPFTGSLSEATVNGKRILGGQNQGGLTGPEAPK